MIKPIRNMPMIISVVAYDIDSFRLIPLERAGKVVEKRVELGSEAVTRRGQDEDGVE